VAAGVISAVLQVPMQRPFRRACGTKRDGNYRCPVPGDF